MTLCPSPPIGSEPLLCNQMGRSSLRPLSRLSLALLTWAAALVLLCGAGPLDRRSWWPQRSFGLNR
jgi:hypothetical protein